MGRALLRPARVRRQVQRRQDPQGLGHSILVALFHMLDRGEPYRDLGADYFTRRQDPARHAQRLAAQLNALGYDAVITRRPSQAPEAA